MSNGIGSYASKLTIFFLINSAVNKGTVSAYVISSKRFQI